MKDTQDNSGAKIEKLLDNMDNIKKAYNIQTDRNVKIEPIIEPIFQNTEPVRPPSKGTIRNDSVDKK